MASAQPKPDFNGQQGRQDSNLQPPVLETGALPVELRPLAVRGCDCTRVLSASFISLRPPGQRRALGALFLVLALMLAGIATAAADAARHEARLLVIAFAAGALALWLGLLAVRALRNSPS
jgi:hypothetical protein